MATVQPRHERNDPNAGMQGAYYTVDIAMGAFLDTETINGGRLSPCAANDFATKPTTLAQSLLVSRGNFGIVFENDDFVPTTGTQSDDSTSTTTKVLYIKDKIAEALYASHTELMTVFNPTSGAGLIQNTEVSVGPVMLVSQDEILDGITVAEVAGFRSNVDAETPTDNALTYSAE